MFKHSKCRKRRSQFRTVRKTVCIFCNGEKTEKIYFDSLIADLRLQAKVEVISSDHNRKSLVEKVRNRLKRMDSKFDKIWVVFDVDALPKGASNPSAIKSQANDAVSMCTASGYTAIVSNECFELWFLLHYDNIEVHLHRDIITSYLTSRIGFQYEKDTPMYDILKDNLQKACDRAKQLCEKYPSHVPVADRTPYTNVYILVDFLIHKKINGCDSIPI